MPTERCDMPKHGIMREQSHAFAAADERAHGHATAKCFAEHKDVGLNAEVLEREELACATEAGLHFIEYEQRTDFIAPFPQGLHPRQVGYAHSSIALDRFHHHAGRAFGDARQVKHRSINLSR